MATRKNGNDNQAPIDKFLGALGSSISQTMHPMLADFAANNARAVNNIPILFFISLVLLSFFIIKYRFDI